MEIHLLQSVPVIKRDGKVISVNSKKSQALLFYIFLAGEEVYRRDYLASLFWDDRSLDLAQVNLRQAFARIKRFCGNMEPELCVDRKEVKVTRENTLIDTDRFLSRLMNSPEKIDESDFRCDLDDIFTGYEDISAPFQSWMQVYKSEFERRATQALNRILTDARDTPEIIKPACDLLLKLDPTNEHAVRNKIRYYAGKGMQAEALSTYNELYKLLDDQYDVEPSNKTVELIAKIKLGEFIETGSDFVDSLHINTHNQSPPQVFVSEFDIEEQNPITRRMGNFFRAEVLGNLSKFREWNVVDVKPLAEDYYQLDCQIEGYDEDIAVVVTVRSFPEHRIIWSERFVTGFLNWRETQWKIAQNLAVAINQSVTTDRIRACLVSPPEERSAFDKWAMCHNINLDWSPDASNEVISILKDIIAIAPNFNLAHSYLAEMHNKMHLVYPGIFRSAESVQTAIVHARQALNLDPLDSHAHRVFAWAKALNGDFELAEFHFSQAYELNPSNLYVATSCALGFAFLDNIDRACSIVDEVRYFPVPLQGFQWGYIQNIYFLAGRYADALAAGEMAGDAISNLPAWQAAILVQLGRLSEAKASKARFFASTRNKWHGKELPDETAMLKWLFHCFPLRNSNKLALFRDSVVSA